MKAVLVLALLLAVASATTIRVRVNVFGTDQDPTFSMNADSKLMKLLQENVQPVYRPWPWYRMGFRGFEVSTEDKTYVVYGNMELEVALVSRLPLTKAVTQHILEHIKQRPDAAPLLTEEETKGFFNLYPSNRKTSVGQDCTIPVRGPDNSTVYDVSTDDCGFFVKYQSDNNCYAYGTDIVTNTFPQPGRGSGQKWTENTCDNIRQAATRDGLIWQGTSYPTEFPAKGHWVSLHIWPGSNFHWTRRDTNLENHWSHKPGGTAVRDVDNNNVKITDPSKADLSPWSQFCGYMLAIPSTAKIN